MGKRRRGGDICGGVGGGGFGDQYGDGWGGGHGSHDDANHTGSGRGMKGGGDAGGSKGGAALTLVFQRQVPKFLRGLVQPRVNEDAAVLATEDYAGDAVRRAAAYGDEEDVAAAARAGLGSRGAGVAAEAPLDGFAGVDASAARAEAEQKLAESEKASGNRAFSEGRHADAVRAFSVCIRLDPSSHIYFSNRCAAHLALKDFESALSDAHATTRLSPTWPKGWARLGASHLGLKRFTDAREAYERAAALEPSNEAYSASVRESEEAERRALAASKFTFRAAPERVKKAEPVARGGARNAALLSFDGDQDE